MAYEAWLFLHPAGVIVFFATFVAAFFWRARAERTHDRGCSPTPIALSTPVTPG